VKIVQRVLDIIFSGIAILLLSPVLLVVMLILRFTGEGEIFFSQIRVGKSGADVRILKFATMMKDSPNLGAGTLTLKNDPRVLPVGYILRKTKINEIPQLFNIFKGDMSIIGPRPQTSRCFAAFSVESQDAIMSVRPGLSGIGSVYFRNEELMLNDAENADYFYDNIIMPFKGELEEWYVSNRSISLYIALIIATMIVLFSGKLPFANSIFSTTPRAPKALRPYV
jgi:lipopolysaccharide/colanic/teichoic acid biosynthesis glycosyltransferase